MAKRFSTFDLVITVVPRALNEGINEPYVTLANQGHNLHACSYNDECLLGKQKKFEDNQNECVESARCTCLL